MDESRALLRVRNLKTYFKTDDGDALAVDDVSFDVPAGKTVALVGESGCGKSVTALSILRLVPDPPGRIAGGEIRFEGRNLLQLSEAEMRTIRGNRISMIFQEPMTSLNPVFRVGNQIAAAIRLHRKCGWDDARAQAIDLLDRVGIPAPAERVNDYPHQMSGGMRQRVMIAMALACGPALLIADEPTTALDVTIQAQILELLGELQRDTGMTVLLITHDLAVVAETADEAAIMYAGRVVEYASVRALFGAPKHPYTLGLFDSVPRLDSEKRRLSTIAGQVPAATDFPPGCRFHSRCPYAMAICREKTPVLQPCGPAHTVACWLHDGNEMAAQGKPAGIPVAARA
ncbi:MAG TPA: ABC transporter ATP-binding protein [Candidatus Hydrogenedentes bacterium]|nr:ABC transporter ATP-binding protein [Candidatus Hydrogenedentota bacterium]HPG67177.1 ABC transporter ATP-binding protein [Candidatus Hydrogenedentota bacterium]